MRYAPYFCEENVWHLAQERAGQPGERLAVFVLGAEPLRPAVAVWGQRAAAGAPFVIWDYHVVLFERPGPQAGWQVWDQDSTLGIPIDASRWLDGSFAQPLPGLAPRFRVLGADDFLRAFSSDRRHMLAADGTELHPFPPWPPILDAEGRHLLPRFIDASDPFLGERCDLPGMRLRFTTAAGAP